MKSVTLARWAESPRGVISAKSSSFGGLDTRGMFTAEASAAAQ
jgi:hypothetical protein